MVVYDPEWNSTVSVHLSHSLDLGSELDSSQDRTFSGVVNSAAVGQRLLISSGDMPKITEYEISEDLAWTEGKSVSFLDYPLSDNANFYYQYLVDDHTAYMPFDVTSRVLWDPTTMTLGETLRDSSVPATKDGLTAHDGGNRAAVRFTGPVRQPIYYTDKDYFAFSQDTLLAIYDEKTHAEKAVVSLPCPAVTTATVDEKGYTYYSSWEFQGTRALFGEGPKPCVARLKPDLTVDSEWTTDLRDITDGRYVNNLRYLGKGKAVANVLHHEVLEADWKGGYNADVATTIAKDGEHWRVWLFDLDKHTGKPVEGLDLPVNGHSSLEQVDGRSFLFAVYENWARSRIYELSDDGKATKRVDLKGVAAKWIRVR